MLATFIRHPWGHAQHLPCLLRNDAIVRMVITHNCPRPLSFFAIINLTRKTPDRQVILRNCGRRIFLVNKTSQRIKEKANADGLPI